MKYIDLGSCLARATRRWGDRVCATSGSASLTFEQLYERSLTLADALRSSGLDEGDRVGVLLRNGLEYLEIMFATTLAGVVVVPINRRLGPSEVEFIARDAELALLITEPMFDAATAGLHDSVPTVVVGASITTPASYEALMELGSSNFSPVGVEDDDAMQSIHYTSGTTGNPKGVMRSHASNFAKIAGMTARYPLKPGDTWLYAIPAHSAGFYPLAIAPMLQGARLLLTTEFDAVEALALLKAERVVGTLLVPTMWELLLNVPGATSVQLPDLRHPLWGGMPLRSGTAKRLDEWLPVPVLGSYGLTEATCICYATLETYSSGRWDCAGIPIDTMEFRIVDDAGADLPSGEYGEVLIRGSALMNGYYNQPELTASAIQDGWFHTGDWGRLDEDGALAVVDRKKDMIISGGENIYPSELEDSLSRMAGVLEVAVVGIPDEVWGQSVYAVIVASDDSVSEASVIEWCLANHSSYKKPRRVIFTDELPKNALGKVVKPQIVESVMATL
jgi:acyl-CoA synthetase (AMP-forming)/AMP-acid ligase II